MEALILYPLILMAVGLMVAGAYGAMPVLVRHHQDTGPASNGINLGLGSGIGLIEPGRLSNRGSPFQLGKNRGPSRDIRDESGPSETEAILTGLFTEVDSLRGELEGLRNEISALVEAANNQPARKTRVK